MVELRHCPDIYYEGCLNATRLCLQCAAGYGRVGGKLHYQPRPGAPTPHPFRRLQREASLTQEQQKRVTQQQRSQIVKRARQEEERARQSLIQATVNSGATYGDGDYKLTDWLYCDHKHRQKCPNKQFNLTLAEYEKGVAQGIHSWVVTIHPQPGQTLRGVFLTEEAFARLLSESKITLKEPDHV